MAKKDITEYIGVANIVDMLDDEYLNVLGQRCLNEYLLDDNSRKEWLKRQEEWMKLATQVEEVKNYPWPNAANVKFPTLTMSAIHFAARAYPALIQSQPVRCECYLTESPESADRARRIERHMSWQLMEQMEEWQDDTDRMFLLLSILGCAFKKTYYGGDRNYSELVFPRDLVANYDIRKPVRLTHVIWMTPNAIKERQLEGLFTDYPDIEFTGGNIQPDSYVDETVSYGDDEDAPRKILEQHRWMDLDEDGLKEPYIVTLDADTGKIFRIVARYNEDSIKRSLSDVVYRIDPIEYFTKFSFIPNPDGKFYDIGFGDLLGPTNKACNTSLNQLLDSGTLNNMQGGLLGSGIRMKGGNMMLEPGKWIPVETTGASLKDNIIPWPTKEPSAILFQLFGAMSDAGNRLGVVTDPFVGETPDQNTPATTTLAVMKQGMKVFNAIIARLHRSFTKELEKLYRLNGENLDSIEFFGAGFDISVSDYMSDMVVVPKSNPNDATDSQKMINAQAYMQLSQQGMINPSWAARKYMEALEMPFDEQAFQMPEPQPEPLIQLEAQRIQLEGLKLQIDKMKADSDALKTKAGAILDIARAESLEKENQLDRYKVAADLIEKQNQMQQQVNQQQQGEVNEPGTAGMETEPSDEGANTSS